MWGGVTSEAASQTSPKGFSLADVFKPFQLPISKVSSSDVLKALGKFLPFIYQKGITSNQTLNCPACTTCPEAPYHIGDFAEGGVIIWLTLDRMHGLVAATKDAAILLSWSTSTGATDATNNNPLPFETPEEPYGNYYGGYLNQNNATIKNNLDDYPAFKAAAEYSIEVHGKIYDDWWLPSSTELSLMYASRGLIQKVSEENGGNQMANFNYWSSRERQTTTSNAWYLNFADGTQSHVLKTGPNYFVRCVRAF